EIVVRLRRKEQLPVEGAAAGVAAPATVLARDEETIRSAGLQPPLLVKPAEGQEFALAFGEKAVVALDPDAAVAAWRRAHEHGFDTIVQELIPDSHDFVFSLLTYIGREGEPLASVTGRKVRQGPLRFGTSAVFEARREPEVEEQGLRLLRHVGYTGFAHVELVRDPRDGELKLVEVNTRLPIWAGIAMGAGRDFNLARIAFDDLIGRPPQGNGTAPDGISWIYMAKDVWVSAQMARLEALEPDIVHVQWLPRPELGRRWIRRIRTPSVLTAHDVVPRRERARAVWPGLLGWFGRVVVHSQHAVGQLAELGVDARRIPHPVFEGLEVLPPPQGKTLLFFGLIREYQG